MDRNKDISFVCFSICYFYHIYFCRNIYIYCTYIHTCLFTKVAAIFLGTLRSFSEKLFHKAHLNDHFCGAGKSYNQLITVQEVHVAYIYNYQIHISNKFQMHEKFLFLHIDLYLLYYSEFYTIALFRYIFYRRLNSQIFLFEKKSSRKFK